MMLPGATDGDTTALTQTGFLAGDKDVDLFRLHGTDTTLGFMDPLVSVASPATLRVCTFVKCSAGETVVESCGMTASADKLDDFQGCCADKTAAANATVRLDYKCVGSFDESADFLIRVDRAPANMCSEYTVHYSL